MSMKVKSARFFKATGPRSLFSALEDGGFAAVWVLDQGLLIRKALKKAVARLAMSHRQRLECFVPQEWSVLAIDIRLDGLSPVGVYLETVTADGPLRIKVSESTGWNWAHSLIYVTDSDGLSDEILAADAVTNGAFYEYVRYLWGTGNYAAMRMKYSDRILKEDPVHYCLDLPGRATY